MAAGTTPPINPFLDPSRADEQQVPPPASDCGEAAMHRLRHPFSVETSLRPGSPAAVPPTSGD